ncbi:DUF3290 domain-containing protein [Enterococcus lemanii]|jgi:uncharacterized membrane protein YbjE (DUF340 family)|uniref:DUF3290 domain-containing protein n=1 Tax=Enterococcus lemanii TaxID=1159752 RepID=A0ABV9MVC6_9ENTE|nr:DUF3290 domain-containing protein [Enterococcus lemanii]MBM7710264.1 uncharacterized membrane protein YbjE (DUF340 family) [Enterococcus lemanii]NLM66748.1 DUF3290 domain-containing protein [Enterococcus sp.]
MNFYGINYLQSQSNIDDYLKYVFIFGSLVILVIVFGLYMRHRLQTKYRDLSIIFLLLLLFALGVQYSDYQNNQVRHSRFSQMVNFVQGIAKEQAVEVEEIFVSSTQLVDGTLVKIGENFYKVNLSADQGSYTLTRAYLMNEKIVMNR